MLRGTLVQCLRRTASALAGDFAVRHMRKLGSVVPRSYHRSAAVVWVVPGVLGGSGVHILSQQPSVAVMVAAIRNAIVVTTSDSWPWTLDRGPWAGIAVT